MITRSVLNIIPTPLSANLAAQLFPQTTIFITRDAFGIADVLAEQLRIRNYQANVVDELPTNCEVAIVLDALQPFDAQASAIAMNEKIFRHLQRIAAHFSKNGGRLIAVADMGGRFAATDTPSYAPWAAGVSGLIKTVAQEWPQAMCKFIDLQRADQTSQRLAERLVSEIIYSDQRIEIGLLADGRRVSVDVVAHPSEQQQLPLAENAVVLVTGGGRGVTAACLIALAQKVKLRLVLFGRTALSAEPEFCQSALTAIELKQMLFAHYQKIAVATTPKQIQAQVTAILNNREIGATIASLEQLGSTVRYLALDVLDATALQHAVADIRDKWGSIAGIIHGAGVLADKLMTEKTLAQFRSVFDTKVLGLKNLLAVTQADNLKLLALFSSVAGRFGNLGQSDYAMANEVLNKVAQHYQRQHQDCRVKSINWGPWESGMVTEQLKQLFLARGVALLPMATGTQLFVEEICSADRQVEVVVGGRLQPTSTVISVESSVVPPSQPLAAVKTLTISVDQHSHPYLVSHLIKNVPVLPACLALEWLVMAAKKFYPQLKVIVCKNFRVLHGIQLKNFYIAPENFVVTCVEQHNHCLALTLTVAGASLPNYSADILLAPDQPMPSVNLKEMPLSGLHPWPYELDQVYADASHQNLLFHGEHFQSICQLDEISDHSATVTINGVTALAWPGVWQTDALAIDSIFQLGILWGQHMLGKPSLPAAFAECCLYFDIPPTHRNLRCILFNGHIKGRRVIYDALVLDNDGRVYAQFNGVEEVCYAI